jgi:hypothetical protein
MFLYEIKSIIQHLIEIILKLADFYQITRLYPIFCLFMFQLTKRNPLK